MTRGADGDNAARLFPGIEDYPWEGGVNGTFYRIKRGIKVKVPKNVAELIDKAKCCANRAGTKHLHTGRGMGKRLG